MKNIKFKVGDMVRVLDYSSTMPEGYVMKGTIQTITEFGKFDDSSFDYFIGACGFKQNELELLELFETKKFKVGDEIELIKSNRGNLSGYFKIGDKFIINEIGHITRPDVVYPQRNEYTEKMLPNIRPCFSFDEIIKSVDSKKEQNDKELTETILAIKQELIDQIVIKVSALKRTTTGVDSTITNRAINNAIDVIKNI